MNPVKPIINQDDLASAADWTFGIVIVRTVVWSICWVITITIIFLKGVNFHSSYCFQEGLSYKGWHLLNNSISILNVEINAIIIGFVHNFWNFGEFGGYILMMGWWEVSSIIIECSLDDPFKWTIYHQSKAIYILFILSTTIMILNRGEINSFKWM